MNIHRIHCRKFTTHKQYKEFIRHNDLLLPNVSICANNLTHTHFNFMYDPYNGYEYIDLGLPSGLKWAKCNIGANEPYEYGDYFMWGSTVPNTNEDDSCDWAYAPFNNGSISYDSNYFNSVKDIACPKGTLAPEYDAARVIMGGGWRMPTKNDFNELLNNTTNTWVTDYQNSGINGRLFTSKTDDSKTLFIPASGYRVVNSLLYSGILATLRSSSLDVNLPECALNFGSDASTYMIYDELRAHACCLRGVVEFYH